MGRWTKTDLIDESTEKSSYLCCNNNIINQIDCFGLSWTILRKNEEWGEARRSDLSDSLTELSIMIGLAKHEIQSWLKNTDLTAVSDSDMKTKCTFKFPNNFVIFVGNTWILPKLFFANFSMRLSDALESRGFMVSNYREDEGISWRNLTSAIKADSTWGYALFGHGYVVQREKWYDFRIDYSFGTNGDFVFNDTHVSPSDIKRNFKYGLGINYQCFANFGKWNSLSIIYYGGIGLTQPILGPLAIDHIGTWNSLINKVIK